MNSYLFLANRLESMRTGTGVTDRWMNSNEMEQLSATRISTSFVFRSLFCGPKGQVSESDRMISAQKLVGERRLRRQAWMAEDAEKSRLRTLSVRASDRNYEDMMKSGQQDITEKSLKLRCHSDARVRDRVAVDTETCILRLIVSARSDPLTMPMNSPIIVQGAVFGANHSFDRSIALAEHLFGNSTESEALYFSDNDEYSNDDEYSENEEDFSEYWN